MKRASKIETVDREEEEDLEDAEELDSIEDPEPVDLTRMTVQEIVDIPKYVEENPNEPNIAAFLDFYFPYVESHPEDFYYELYRDKPVFDGQGAEIKGRLKRFHDIHTVDYDSIADEYGHGTFHLRFCGWHHGRRGSIISRLNNIRIAAQPDFVGKRPEAKESPIKRGLGQATAPQASSTDAALKVVESMSAAQTEQIRELTSAIQLQQRGDKAAIERVIEKMSEGAQSSGSSDMFQALMGLVSSLIARGPEQDSKSVETLREQLREIRQELADKERVHSAAMTDLRQTEASSRQRLSEEYAAKLADEREARAKLVAEYSEKIGEERSRARDEIDRMRETNQQMSTAALEAKQAKIEALERDLAEKREALTKSETRATTLETDLRRVERELTEAKMEAKFSAKRGDDDSLDGITKLSKGIVALKEVSEHLGGGGGSENSIASIIQSVAPVGQQLFATVGEALRARGVAGDASAGATVSGAEADAAWRQHVAQQAGAEHKETPAPSAPAPEQPMPLGAPPDAPAQPKVAVPSPDEITKIIQQIISITEDAVDLDYSTNEYFTELQKIIPLEKAQLEEIVKQASNEQIYREFGVDPNGLSRKARAYFERFLNELRGEKEGTNDDGEQE